MKPSSRIIGLVKARPLLSGTVAAGVLAVGAYLFFGVFGFHLVFVDDVVEEADPFVAAEASGSPSEMASDDVADESEPTMDDEPSDDGSMDEPMPAPTATETPADTGPRTVAEGTFTDRSHPTSGQVAVLTDGSRRVLRIEDLRTDNGPDLNVYLVPVAPDAPAQEFDDDFVDLGDLKGNIGDQNYEIPEGVDLDRYSTVVIWCVRFSVAFGTAGLA